MIHAVNTVIENNSNTLLSMHAAVNFRNNALPLQERELALFFLDIRDFTPFIASRPALEVMYLLQELFGIFRKAIESNKGTIIETAGDGLYAVFGLDGPVSQAANSAVQAGFSILTDLEEANQSYFSPLFGHFFQIGIGVHVGKAIVGKLGLGVNNNMTVMGYAVNLAARLQQATKPLNNSFVVSREVYQLLSVPPVSSSRRITLKGIEAALDVHLLGNAYRSTYQQMPWKVAC